MSEQFQKYLEMLLILDIIILILEILVNIRKIFIILCICMCVCVWYIIYINKSNPSTPTNFGGGASLLKFKAISYLME